MTKVASIGECMIELRHRGERELDLGFGGDTLNFAVYLARLSRGRDVAVDYVTALGDDPYSDAMLAAWQAEGIGCDLVARLPGRLPGLHTIRTDARGRAELHLLALGIGRARRAAWRARRPHRRAAGRLRPAVSLRHHALDP